MSTALSTMTAEALVAVSANAVIGNAGLMLILAASSLGALTTAYAIMRGDSRSIRHAGSYAWLIVIGASISVIAMQLALHQRDFEIGYIQRVGSWTTPTLYNIAAMWSALEGSILLWVFTLAVCVGLVAWRYRRRLDDPLVGWAMVVLFVVTAFFAMVTFGPANPFAAGEAVSPNFDGRGPNPLLQNDILVLFHPPILYLGYVGITIPFAFAIAALISGRVGEQWLVETRRWALFSWGFLTVGIIIGGWWSYKVLGWGGVWGWDPVENASLMPWLTGTAYLHSVLVQQRRGMLRVWNLSLLVATFALTILGTFLTRSGVISSVHAFGTGEIDGYLLGFFAFVVVVSLGLIAWRGDRLRAPGVIDSPISREGAFLANNVVLAGFAFIVLVGTVFPLIVEVVDGRRTSVGAPYFNQLSTPIGLILLFLMAVAPVLPWRKASEELLRDRLFWPAWMGVGTMALAIALGADGWAPMVAFGLGGFAAGAALRQLVLATRRLGWRGLLGRTNGGMVVHLGVILIAVALVASGAYTTHADVTLTRDTPVEFQGHTLTYLGTDVEVDDRTDAAYANIDVDGERVLRPALTVYLLWGQQIPTPGIATYVGHDLYLAIGENRVPTEASDEVVIAASSKPLLIWMWLGGVMVALGTVLAAFPGRRRNPLAPVSSVASGPDPASAPSHPDDDTDTAGRSSNPEEEEVVVDG